MGELATHDLNLPSEQQAIRDRCFHPTGTFIEFPWEEIEQSVSARLEKQVHLYPNNLAIKTTLQEITYTQLNQDANQVAHAILGQTGIGDGPVCILFEQGIQAITAVFGVLKAGRAFVPLDPSFPRSRNSYMVEDVGSHLILTDSKNWSLANELASSGHRVIDIEALGSGLPVENPGLAITPNALAYILYTSGSTGQPKGVAQSQRNVLHAAMNHANLYHLSPADRLTMLSALVVSSGLRDIFRALLNGASLYHLDLKSDGIGSLLDWLKQNEITIYHSVPTVYRLLLSTMDNENCLPDLRLLVVSGETLLKTDTDQFIQKFSNNCIMINVLGLTEVSTFCCYFLDHMTEFQGNSVPVGYDIPEGVEVLLLDDHLEEVGTNRIGQIAVRSRYLPPGYWNRPDLAQAAFMDDPDGGDLRIFFTGDLGQMREDGCLEHLGRMDSQVKVRGFRVELSEIENLLIGLDSIREVAVVADQYHSSNYQKLIAYFVPFDNQAPPTPGDLRLLIKTKLPDYMIPSVFVKLDSLPKLHGGKIDRSALPRPGQARPDLKTPFVTPQSSIEQVLAEIWSQVLEIDRVGRDDNFLDLGGDSLRAGQVISRVINAFQVELPLRSLFEAPTIAEMALVVTQSQAQKIGPEKVEQMLANLENLEDGQSKGLLAKESKPTMTNGEGV